MKQKVKAVFAVIIGFIIAAALFSAIFWIAATSGIVVFGYRISFVRIAIITGFLFAVIGLFTNNKKKKSNDKSTMD